MRMRVPIFILSPPRSYSSVVSSILGEHPELHSFPELQIFKFKTIEELIKQEMKGTEADIESLQRYGKGEKKPSNRIRPAPPGLLRAISFLHEGIQNEASLTRAWLWLLNNQTMNIDELFIYLCSGFEPARCIEKTPANSSYLKRLIRILKSFPDAKFLHLTRSCLPSLKSIDEFLQLKAVSSKPKFVINHPVMIWYKMHSTIKRFRQFLNSEQYLMIRGEDILSEPYNVLPCICEWIGISESRESVDFMLQPEKSPYAFFGPPKIAGGNDPKFMDSPKFRLRVQKSYNANDIKSYFEIESNRWFLSTISGSEYSLARLKAMDRKILESIFSMERSLGYSDGML